ncbi:MAG: DUF6128 domain-containing protein [Eubacteriales bacterium]|nr:DUF6128 domain-containing protein [Eubacteriales bacterium]
MSGYKRFVSYIYAYPNGKKERNTGFAKVEARGGRCKIQIRLQKIPQEEKALDVYGFVREGEVLRGIFLGRIPGVRGAAEGMIATMEERMGESPWALGSLAGLWARGESGMDYITVWDDLPVEVGMLVTEEEAPEEGDMPPSAEELEVEENSEVSEMQEESDASSVEPTAEEGITMGEPQGEGDTSSSEEPAVEEKSTVSEPQGEGDMPSSAEELAVEENTTVSEPAVEEGAAVSKVRAEGDMSSSAEELAVEENSTVSESAVEEGAAVSEVQEERDMTPAEPAVRVGTTVSAPPEKSDASRVGAAAEVSTSMSAPRTPKPTARPPLRAQEAVCPLPASLCPHTRYCPPGLEYRWNCLSKNYPHRNPFHSPDIRDCIQICPRDISALRQQNWNLSRNSFLIHGYYNFRHLLLIQRQNGTCLLGVPGLYDPQEEKMAAMFGFPMFLDAPVENREGRFGYWCRPVE